MWIAFFLLSLLAAIGLLVFVYVRDKRYLSKPVREVLGDDVKKEIEQEKMDFSRHQSLFEKAIEKAKKKITN